MKPLPLNFPQTFLPDRRLLGQLLAFAGRGGSGTVEEISDETGIPNGKKTGKVEPMIHFTRGMGLLSAEKSTGVWKLTRTPLGEMVSREDAFLSEPLTMWLAHLLLSRRLGRAAPATGVADPWFVMFAEGRFRLGERFDLDAYLRLLSERHGAKQYLKSLAGLVARMYSADTSFADAAILSSSKTAAGEPFFRRESAPAEIVFYPAYAVFLWLIWDEAYSDVEQMSFDELASETRLLSLLGWDGAQTAVWLDWLADQHLAQLDRYTGSVVLLRLVKTGQVIDRLYSELV
ncbi:hypothetical protein [Thiocapsa marina]|uniref:DUF4007 domain-containing protein n=1 Tax=Thiocapsa marina 5811 TaxID=768671 RepID=F9UFZ9_9GAMM|nr:hypothetical protein [Thiocapsa marina]EGV17023.1 hypothetical protein ThimaDRAFT_3852 [Thiocapsa marina 5811]